MGEVVYKNLGELVKEAKRKYGFQTKKRKYYPAEHKRGTTFLTGFYSVYRIMNDDYKQGFTFQYRYYDEDDERRNISSVDLKKLYRRVKYDNNLPWKIADESEALKTAKECGINIEELM